MSDLLDGFRVGFDIFRPAIEAKLQKRRIKQQGKQDRKTAVTRGEQDRLTEEVRGGQARLTQKEAHTFTDGQRALAEKHGINLQNLENKHSIKLEGIKNKSAKELQRDLFKHQKGESKIERSLRLKMQQQQLTAAAKEGKLDRASTEKLNKLNNSLKQKISKAEIGARKEIARDSNRAAMQRLNKTEQGLFKRAKAGDKSAMDRLKKEIAGKKELQGIVDKAMMDRQESRQDADAVLQDDRQEHDRDMVKRTLRAEKSMHDHRRENPDKNEGELMDLYLQERSIRYGELQDLMGDQSVPYKKRIEAYRRLHGMHTYDQQRQATAYTLADSGNVDGLIKYGDFLIGQREAGHKRWSVPLAEPQAPSSQMHMARPAPRNIYSGGSGSSTDPFASQFNSGTTTPNVPPTSTPASPAVTNARNAVNATPAPNTPPGPGRTWPAPNQPRPKK